MYMLMLFMLLNICLPYYAYLPSLTKRPVFLKSRLI